MKLAQPEQSGKTQSLSNAHVGTAEKRSASKRAAQAAAIGESLIVLGHVGRCADGEVGRCMQPADKRQSGPELGIPVRCLRRRPSLTITDRTSTKTPSLSTLKLAQPSHTCSVLSAKRSAMRYVLSVNCASTCKLGNNRATLCRTSTSDNKPGI